MSAPKKKGRPAGPVKVTLNTSILPATHAALEARRTKTGLSIGQVLDSMFYDLEPADRLAVIGQRPDSEVR